MRYLLDTNILVHLVKDNKDEISNDVWEIINDFSNQIYTSSISVIELFQLHRIGKIRPNFKTKEEMIDYIRRAVLYRNSSLYQKDYGNIGISGYHKGT